MTKGSLCWGVVGGRNKQLTPLRGNVRPDRGQPRLVKEIPSRSHYTSEILGPLVLFAAWLRYRRIGAGGD